MAYLFAADEDERSIVGLTMVVHALVHTYELSLPILVTIWHSDFGISTAVLGALLSAGYVLFGIGALPGGVLADTYGSDRLILVCLVGMGVAFLGLSIAPGVLTLALALVVWGLAASIYHPSGLSLLSKGTDHRGTAFAYHGIAGNVGIALGPLATAVLLLALDWRIVVGLLAVPAFLAAGYATRVESVYAEPPAKANRSDHGPSKSGTLSGNPGRPTSLSELGADSRTLFSGTFVAVFTIVVLSGLYYRGVLTFLPAVLTDFQAFTPIDIGGWTVNPERYFYAGILAIGVVGQYAGGRLVDVISTHNGLAVAFAALAVLALLFVPAASAGFLPLLLLGALLGFTLFLVQPFYQAAVAESTPLGTRGLSYGYTYLGLFGVGALGGALAGAILAYASVTILFVVLGGIASLATVSALVFGYARRNPSIGGRDNGSTQPGDGPRDRQQHEATDIEQTNTPCPSD